MLKLFFDRADLVIKEVATEAVAIAVVLTIFFFMRGYVPFFFRAAERVLGRIARRPGLAVALIGLLALGMSAAFSLISHIPNPLIHDEFSNLLTADTFAHGRLTNPTHPLWVHFESMHIIQQPTYMSKYPPAQGLMLAVGQVIGGHPIVGAWLGTALASAAVCWMLLAWLPPRWAVLGSLLVVLHPGVLIQWGQSYWGGAMAMMGGALVFGAVRRIVRTVQVRDAVLLGVGLAVLANSRPYEGLVASLPVAVVLLAWMLGENGPSVRVSIERVVLPISIVLVLTAAAMGFYNLRVTGDAFRMPYMVHEATYAMAPIFLWQEPRPAPTYRHESLRFHHMRGLMYHSDQRSIWGLAVGGVEKAKELWKFYQGTRGLQLVLTLPLLALPWVLRDRWLGFALLTCGILIAGMAMSTWVKTHYAAPVVGLVCVLVLQAIRYIYAWRWRGRPTGRYLVRTFFVIAVASFMLTAVAQMRIASIEWGAERAQLLAQLDQDGRRHLVLIPQGPLDPMYRKRPQEWVYNEADIDAARIVWARELEMDQNRKLFEYFKDRDLWLLNVNQFPPQLMPYPVESRRDAPAVGFDNLLPDKRSKP